ncbi:MAG: circularly permuted type 2 ATP-grasp protein [Myxococcota bacterium]
MVQSRSSRLFEGYEPLPGTFDEFFGPDGTPHPPVEAVVRLLSDLDPKEFRRRQLLADTTFLRSGVTFSVYGSDDTDTERIFPFDLIPRIVSAQEWQQVERGLVQRIRALNLFLNDVYGEQRIVEEGVVPRFMVESSKAFQPKMQGIQPPKGVYIHIAGVDLIRGRDGGFLVLEDNVRTPSGVSYVLENRMMMKKVFGPVFRESAVAPIEMYPTKLREMMAAVAPGGGSDPHVVVLTPGPFNSAYFEHSFLARRVGCELVQGSDLFVEDDRVYAKTTRGPSRVDVIYRRVDDDFLDPQWFRPDSMLGVPGLVAAYAKGNVAIVNAIGNGIADDKGIYPYVPDMIRFYLSEEPILPQVPTYICDREDDRRYVLEHLDELVVKAVNESGGYGMLMGPKASRRERAEFHDRIAENPRNYIAQPLVELSAVPTWTRHGVGPRRVDLRPFVLSGDSTWVLPGGLTRVALTKGSYVVNSSQGGGSKDTWVVGERQP